MFAGAAVLIAVALSAVLCAYSSGRIRSHRQFGVVGLFAGANLSTILWIVVCRAPRRFPSLTLMSLGWDVVYALPYLLIFAVAEGVSTRALLAGVGCVACLAIVVHEAS